MIPLWQDELRELAAIESKNHAAITFYFEPLRPRNRAHREEVILVKDLVKNARRQLERNGGVNGTREALDRIQALGERLQRNGSRAKAVFACPEKKLWREFDVSGSFGTSQLHVNSRFHLRPFAAAVLDAPHCMVVLADREHAQILDLYMDEISVREKIVDQIPRRVRSDGFMGYGAGHIERHVDNGVMRHFKHVADRVLELSNHGDMDHVIFCLRPEVWPEIEPHLHSYVKQRIIGRIEADTALANMEEVKERAHKVLEEFREGERGAMMREVIGETQRNGRGSMGLRRVITSLERGEVQILLIGRRFSATAVECGNCGHLDSRMVKSCAICGQATREIDDISDALIGQALRRGVEIHYVDDDPEFDSKGNIGALLRFRADQNTTQKLYG